MSTRNLKLTLHIMSVVFRDCLWIAICCFSADSSSSTYGTHRSRMASAQLPGIRQKGPVAFEFAGSEPRGLQCLGSPKFETTIDFKAPPFDLGVWLVPYKHVPSPNMGYRAEFLGRTVSAWVKVKVNNATPRRVISVGAHLVFGRWARRWISHGICDEWPVRRQTFPAYAGTTKFILLGDSWLPRILIL